MCVCTWWLRKQLEARVRKYSHPKHRIWCSPARPCVPTAEKGQGWLIQHATQLTGGGTGGARNTCTLTARRVHITHTRAFGWRETDHSVSAVAACLATPWIPLVAPARKLWSAPPCLWAVFCKLDLVERQCGRAWAGASRPDKKKCVATAENLVADSMGEWQATKLPLSIRSHRILFSSTDQKHAGRRLHVTQHNSGR